MLSRLDIYRRNAGCDLTVATSMQDMWYELAHDPKHICRPMVVAMARPAVAAVAVMPAPTQSFA